MDVTHDTTELQRGSDSSVGQGERERLLLSDHVMVTIAEFYFYCAMIGVMGVSRAIFLQGIWLTHQNQQEVMRTF